MSPGPQPHSHVTPEIGLRIFQGCKGCGLTGGHWAPVHGCALNYSIKGEDKLVPSACRKGQPLGCFGVGL